MSGHQQRIIDLQAQIKIAREALERIRDQHTSHPHNLAANALDSMFALERKQPLQGLVGHERKRA